jgi:hypothetical protein
MSNDKKQTFTYDAWYRAPGTDRTKDVHITADGPVNVDAKTIKGAEMLAARAIPQEYAEKMEDVEITVRPF